MPVKIHLNFVYGDPRHMNLLLIFCSMYCREVLFVLFDFSLFLASFFQHHSGRKISVSGFLLDGSGEMCTVNCTSQTTHAAKVHVFSM